MDNWDNREYDRWRGYHDDCSDVDAMRRKKIGDDARDYQEWLDNETQRNEDETTNKEENNE